MADQFKANRIDDSTLGNQIDDRMRDLEATIANLLGFTGAKLDSDITGSFVDMDLDGRVTNLMRFLGAAGDAGVRVRESGGSEFKLVCDAGYLAVYSNTGTETVPVWTLQNQMDLTTGLWETGSGGTGPIVQVKAVTVPTADGVVTFDSVVFDTDTMWSSGSPTRLTVPTGAGGYYHVTFWVSVKADVSVPGNTYADVKKNGSAPIAGIHSSLHVTDLNQTVDLGGSGDVLLAAGDYLEFEMYFSGIGSVWSSPIFGCHFIRGV